jgi:FlgD Ig-like domain
MVFAVVLLAGSAAAFTRTEKLKLEPAPVAKPQFDRHLSPTCDCARATAQLTFLLGRPERLDVSVVDSDGAHVVTLAQARDLPAGRASFDWNGRDADGQVVADGTYRLKVYLEHDRRTILIPSTIHVDTVPPEARVLDVESGPGLDVRYRSNEAAKALVVVDDKVVFRSRRRRPGNTRLEWPGPLAPGSHEVTLVLVDQAGNRSQPTQPVVVGGS